MEQLHAKEPWQQGRLLSTATTRKWTEAERQEGDERERRTVFSGFTATDEGRSRKRVATCDDEHDACRIVACVNACAGFYTDTLDLIGSGEKSLFEIFKEHGQLSEVARQRDEALSKLRYYEEELCLVVDSTLIARPNGTPVKQVSAEKAGDVLRQRDELLAVLKEHSLPIGEDPHVQNGARLEFGDIAVDRELRRRAAIAKAGGAS